MEARIPWSHLVPVPEQYQSVGLRIEETHLRGLSVKRLEELVDLIRKVLEAGYTIHDQESGEDVTMDTMNLYHVDEHFIRPLTEAHQCSFVELCTKVKTKEDAAPMFFVSHWWGTPLLDTIRMLKLHKKNATGLRDLRSYTVWICAFSNCQHRLGEEIPDTDNYLETPFARAIVSPECYGTVMLLNESKGVSLERSWCIFEAFVSLTQCDGKGKPQRFDVATIVPEGSCSYDGERNLRCAGTLSQSNGLSSKVDPLGFMYTDHPDKTGTIRPAAFPADICLQGLQINVLEANASKVADKKRIESWIGRQSDEVNHALQKKFIAPALYSAFMTRDPKVTRKVLEISTSIVSRDTIFHIISKLGIVGRILEYTSKSDFDRKNVAKCFEVLIEHGWNPNTPLDSTFSERIFGFPLGSAIEYEHYETARILMDGGADPAKLRSCDLVSINYSKCPEDIKDRLKDGGVLCKGKCVSLFYPFTYCYLFVFSCYSGFLCSPQFYEDIDRAE